MNRKSKFAGVIALLICSIAYVAYASYPTPPSLESEVFVQGGNSFGSTGIYARRWTNVEVNVGSAITYTDDATNGGYFTINADGLYSMTATDYRSDTADGFGIAVNAPGSSPIPTTSAQLCSISTNVSLTSSCSATAYLNSGDVVRELWGVGNATDISASSRFLIVRVK